VSGVLVEVDPLDERSEPNGRSLGDAGSAAIGGLLASLVRQGRGYDRVARVAQSQFLLFLADTAKQNAINAAERIRQTVAAARFLDGHQRFTITVSCAVREWPATETAEAWLEGLHAVLRAAPSRGRNQTFVSGPDGTALATAPQYQVPTREVLLG
jgi:diguanylate cyclase